MRWSKTRVVVCAVTLSLVLTYDVNSPAAEHPRIPSLERFRERDIAPALAGQILISELNCVACHEVDEPIRQKLRSRQAPILTDIGARVRPTYIRDFLMSPSAVKPGTVMPDVLHSFSEPERREHIEALVHFLASSGELTEASPVASSVRSGEQIFHRVGCAACHDSQRKDAPPLATSAPLPHLARKYSIPSLAKFLSNPLASRPSGRMPHLSLNDKEARNLACFLLRDLRATPNVNYAYFEGDWNELPDFSQLTPTTSGTTTGFDILMGRPNHFAIRFEGQVQFQRPGQYQFFLSSDDGSRLIIDGREVVALDGIHSREMKEGRISLDQKVYPIVVEYFEGGGEESLQIEYQGPGVPRRNLEWALLPLEPSTELTTAHFEVDPQLASRGKELFETLGCAACHQREGTTNRTLARSAWRLDESHRKEGCICAPTFRGQARYSLAHVQRRQIETALATLKALDAENAQSSVLRTMLTLNCLACHQRGEMGGVEPARNPHFQSDEPEMGDEGRLPPPLTGVGAKLRTEWMAHIFKDGSKDRPYMFTRMPRFGEANVGHLVHALSSIDEIPSTPSVGDIEIGERKVKSIGRQLAGAQGLSCIKCHSWGDIKSTGIQAMSLTIMGRRLNDDWFQLYMTDPQQFRPGTRMPTAWPNGQSYFPKLLDGDVQKQIHAVRAFLSDGPAAAVPSGLSREPIELAPTTEPIVYRNFIEGSGPRSIAVGYPERVSIAFDANDMRLAMLWQGAFIDASRHWLDRGAGFAPPLGDNVLKLDGEISFARLEAPEKPWPREPARELGWQFRGYRLNKKRQPIFLYKNDPLRIEDEFAPITGESVGGIQRRITLTSNSPADDVWFRAATGKIVKVADDLYRINDDWETRIEVEHAQPVIRESATGQELVVPVALRDGQATIVQEYRW